MTAIPESRQNIAGLIYKAYEKKADSFREHLGASLLGHPCDRYLFLQFRWAVAPAFPGRMLLLFSRGNNEEDQVIKNLKMIGCILNERQTRVDFGSFVSGSCDGIITSGLPGYEKHSLVLEIKTHSRKSFEDLIKKGVALAKEQHYVQMQAYMLGLGIENALYYAVCKDDDRIHTEVIKLDHALATKYVERGKKIAMSDYMPEPLSADPSWYQCKMCNFHEFCHETKLTKEANCRTCALSTANTDSTFTCSKYDNYKIEAQYQRTGCEGHVLHPDLVPWKRMESSSPYEAVYVIEGQPVRNGEPDERVYSSKEIIADYRSCAMPDETTEALRVVFEAKVVSAKEAGLED
jgi:hypothetical protein